MDLDVPQVLLQDHDELDVALSGMLAPTTATSLLHLLARARRRFLAHLRAEEHMWRILGRIHPHPSVQGIAMQAAREHLEQLASLDTLSRLEPGGAAWCEHTLEVRERALDHAFHSDWPVRDQRSFIPSCVAQELAAHYGREHARSLATTMSAALGLFS